MKCIFNEPITAVRRAFRNWWSANRITDLNILERASRSDCKDVFAPESQSWDLWPRSGSQLPHVSAPSLASITEALEEASPADKEMSASELVVLPSSPKPLPGLVGYKSCCRKPLPKTVGVLRNVTEPPLHCWYQLPHLLLPLPLRGEIRSILLTWSIRVCQRSWPNSPVCEVTIWPKSLVSKATFLHLIAICGQQCSPFNLDWKRLRPQFRKQWLIGRNTDKRKKLQRWTFSQKRKATA